MEYEIRAAKKSDLPRIQEIYASARRFMEERGNPDQWGKTRPSTEQSYQDIENNNLYVLADGDVIYGVFALIFGDDPTYRVIWDGQWSSSERYGTIHRIAGVGSRGILQSAVNFAEQYVRYIRIDTHERNIPMRKAVVAAGFQKCGRIFTEDGTERIAYDRLK